MLDAEIDLFLNFKDCSNLKKFIFQRKKNFRKKLENFLENAQTPVSDSPK